MQEDFLCWLQPDLCLTFAEQYKLLTDHVERMAAAD